MNVRCLVLWLVGVGGCSAEDAGLPALEFESRYARLGVKPTDLYPLCGGDLASVDRRVEYVQTQLGVQRETPISIYVLDVEDLPCSEESVGCYGTEIDEIYTPWFSIDREIVHAVAHGIEFRSRFWSEGSAGLLSGRSTFKDNTVTLDPSWLDLNDLETHASAAHFGRFLVETRGWEKYNLAIRGQPLDTVYGESATALTQAYERDVPFSYPPVDACPYPPLTQRDDGVWEESFDLSCASREATQFELKQVSLVADAAVFRSVVLQAGSYAMDLRGGLQLRFYALRCRTGIQAEPSQPSQDPFSYDIEFESKGGFPKEFVGNERHVLDLAAGKYWIAVSSGTLEPTVATLGMTRLE